MTDPNQPDSPSTGRPPDEPSSQGPYISSRLREKLEDSGGDDWEPKSGSPIAAIITAVVVLAIAVGGFFYWSSASRVEKAKKREAELAAARADSLANIARAESLAVAAHQDSITRAAADSVARKQGKLPKTATAAGGKPGGGATGSGGGGSSGGGGGAPAAATDGFGIVVGTYLDEARAKSELDRLSGTTSLSGIVAPTSDGSFRVILGKFSSRGAADRKATALADSGLVREAHVVARPK